MKQGDAFIFHQPGIGPHMWTIISDPSQEAQQVLTVSVTSWRKDADPACPLHPGDHPYITKPSFIYYASAQVLVLEYMEKARAQRFISMLEPLSDSLLQRVLDGAETSVHLKIAHKRLLIRQGIIAG